MHHSLNGTMDPYAEVVTVLHSVKSIRAEKNE